MGPYLKLPDSLLIYHLFAFLIFFFFGEGSVVTPSGAWATGVDFMLLRIELCAPAGKDCTNPLICLLGPKGSLK